jgi:hypothetical protein
VLPRLLANASTTYEGTNLSPLGQVDSSNSGGSCKAVLNAIITAPDTKTADSMEKSINSMASLGIFKEGVRTVSSKVTARSGGGTELQVQTTIEYDCALFTSGSDWKKAVENGGAGILSGVVGGATYHLVNAVALGTLAAAGVPDGSANNGINWLAKIAGCISGAASGFVTLAIATARSGAPPPAAITGNAIGSCIGGSVLTGFDPQETWTRLANLFHAMRGWTTSQWLSADVEQEAGEVQMDIETPTEQAFQQEEMALQTCSADPTPGITPCNP